MEDKVVQIYKDYKIAVDSEGTFFIANDEGRIAESQTLAGIKEIIDKLSKSRLLQVGVFVNPPRWSSEDGNRIVKAKITSFRKSGLYNKELEFRVTWSQSSSSDGKSWRHLSASSLYKDTPENVARILEYNKLMADSEMLRDRAKTVLEKLAVYTEKELLG